MVSNASAPSQCSAALPVPALAWETVGNVPRVIFVKGEVEDFRSTVAYYGTADKYVGAMRVKISIQ
jgi:predicted GH43/DUF377 family glycosyl hydrolase